ncbi:hypothetical protein EJB05_34021 [Eragrostis curvula]|uniref:WRKY domain-containing protein n=1 Tax=Eragrostis curvula TaxID=38414 RepID=A0A5J9U2K2_9POAL|nr:hypothetical protein EJB05_34021 [Eragrostis curvula]
MDLVPKIQHHKQEKEEGEKMILSEQGHAGDSGFGHASRPRSEIKEVDFFSSAGARRRDDDGGDGGGGESRRGPATPGRDDNMVNTALDLLTTVAATTVNGGEGMVAGAAGDHRKEADMATVEVELRLAGEENRRLRRMLEELTRSYGTLYNQLIQAQQHQAASNGPNSMLPAVMPGVQFADPRISPAIRSAAAAVDGDRSSSDGGSGEADDKRMSAQQDGTPERRENAEGSSAAAEVPCRRARVSVRARSEAPMGLYV